jgi:hypothetical protein
VCLLAYDGYLNKLEILKQLAATNRESREGFDLSL